MTINQLKYFCEVAKHKNFTRAAEYLFVCQSTLSKSIKTLEEELKVELVDRNAKTFSLTHEGELFFDYAKNIILHVEGQMQEFHQRISGLQGTLTLGIPPTAGSIFFYSCLREYRKVYPNVSLNIVEVPSKTILAMMENGQLDMGIVLEPFSNDKYLHKEVFSSEIVLAVSKEHWLKDRKTVSVSELKNEKFLMMSKEYMFHDLVIKYFNDAGFTPEIEFESSQWDLIYEMTADNQGVSVFPICLVEKHERSQIKLIKITDPSLPWALSVIYRKGRMLTMPMQNFLNVCKCHGQSLNL